MEKEQKPSFGADISAAVRPLLIVFILPVMLMVMSYDPPESGELFQIVKWAWTGMLSEYVPERLWRHWRKKGVNNGGA
jgi:hypothetical protein